MYNTTDGKLNIAMGSVLRIWHDYREAAGARHETDADNKLPEPGRAGRRRPALRHLTTLSWMKNAKTVYLADPEMSLDVGSVGKGYAVEMVAQAAEARGLTSALISVGGNLRAIGVKAGRQPVVRRRGEPVERLGRLIPPIPPMWRRCQHERYGACDQRRLPAVLRRGRRALPSPDRPGHPLARPLLRQRERPLPGLRRSRLPHHRPVLYVLWRMARSSSSPSTAWKPSGVPPDGEAHASPADWADHEKK